MPKTLVRFLTKAIETFVVLDLMILTALVFCNVVMRYVADTSIVATEELALYLLIWMVYMAAILAFQENSHINVDLLERKLSPRPRWMVRIFCDILMLGACVMLLIGCYIQGAIDMTNAEIITGIPRGIRFVCGGVFSLAVILLLLTRMYNAVLHGPQGDVQS